MLRHAALVLKATKYRSNFKASWNSANKTYFLLSVIPIKDIGDLARQTEFFWLRRYLNQRPLDQIIAVLPTELEY